MLLFALFTLGYFFGVILTLGVFLRKKSVGEVTDFHGINLESIDAGDPWEVHRQLIKVNGDITPANMGSEVGKQKRRLKLLGGLSVAGIFGSNN